MNVFEKVQEARPEIDGAEENISAARGRLLTEIHAEKRPARSRAARRPWIITAGLVGAAAAVTVGVLVVGNLTTPTTGGVEAIPTVVPKPSVEPTPEPTVEPLTASGAFSAAGAAASTFAGLTVAPGQYLRVHIDSEQIVYHQPIPELGQYQADRSNAANAWLQSTNWDCYVPADQSGDWFYTPGDSDGGVTQLFGPDALQLSQEADQSQSGTAYFDQGPSAPWETSGGYSLTSFFADMPRDPAQLIDWIRTNQGTVTGDQDYKVGWLLVDLLSYNVGAPDARAAMYSALSLLAGSELVGSDGATATVSFAAAEQALSGADAVKRRTVKIDMNSGMVLEKTATLDVASTLIPATLADERYIYTVSVVDALP